MNLDPYLTFNGNCEEAFKSYEKLLGGKIESMFTFAGSPAEAHVPPDARNKIMHARMTVGKEVLMGSDAPGQYEKPQGISVSLNLEKAADGERIFNALSDGGQVTMPFQQTFWAHRFGMVVDRFGIPWMINCEKAG